ncbi:MAG: fasciclin domain-containing protein [Saprospiraceae bacterium]
MTNKFLSTLAFVLLAMFTHAQTVVDIIVDSDDHTILESAVVNAGLVGALNGDGPFTVFAPTDAAFGMIDPTALAELTADPTGDLARILLYHVLNAEVLAEDLEDGQSARTLLGQNIDVAIDMDANVTISGAPVSMTNIDATNGVVHVLDAVMLPPASTVVDVVVNSAAHTTLETAVIEAELAASLSGDGPFTVFAPTDDAFDALEDGVLDALLEDPTGDLADVLLYHVLEGEVLSTDLVDGTSATTLLGDDIEITVNMDGAFINGVQVSVADIRTFNGVVHVLDAVLEPPVPTVVDIIVESPDHTILEDAVIDAGLAGALSGNGPFTVFAPTDDAFGMIDQTVLDELTADPTGDLARILLYHVLNGQVLEEDLMDGQSARTLLGQNIDVAIDTDGNVTISGAPVSITNLEGSNGVVHVLDMVMMPPAATVVDVIINSPVHTTLATAVVEAELTGPLNSDGPFTVFAPTDDAFDLLEDGVLDQLLADPTGDLADILLYHVLDGEVLSSDLVDGTSATTLLGDDIDIIVDPNGVFINGVLVTLADIRTFNGVVHVLNAVLTPPVPSVVDIIVESPDHTILEDAVIGAGLVDALSGDGPFTVFAPTDAAFGMIDATALAELTADPTGDLARILLYHVLNGEVLAADLEDGQSVTTLLGQNIEVAIDMDGNVTISGAPVSVTDIPASNGVVHVLDMVMMPPAATIVDVVVNSPVHNTLETAVVQAGLVDALNGDGPFTLFAPTDAAFDELQDGVLDALLADPTGELANILLYHAIDGEVLSTDLVDGTSAPTLFSDEEVDITINSDGVFINDAEVIISDIRTFNGVVHVIDMVLTNTATSVKDLEEANITAFPNPVDNILNITLPIELMDTKVDMNLVDATGKILKSWSVTAPNVEADMTNVPQGFYFLSLTSDTHFARIKVVKN